MLSLHALILLAYFVTVGFLSVFGAHRLLLVLSYYRHRGRAVPLPEPLEDALCPVVLVQLPVYNERFVVERIVDAAAALDWPRNRLRIQLLDDSTDDTTECAQRAVDRHRAAGTDIQLVRRGHREGFKAGALQEGLALDASGRTAAPFVAIFDADFIPNPDFLRRALRPLVEDDGLGMAQGRWAHLNRTRNLLTRAQAILLDGHFVMEHGSRFRAGHFFNFNGTAGVWRRQAIEDAGGWQGDTLTEDLDLSYRAQLIGWRFVYLQCLAVPSELPEEARGFKNQQHRWAKGSIQTARKLLPSIWRSDLPISTRLEATFHMANNLAYPLMTVLMLVLPVALWVRADTSGWLGVLVDLPIFVLATGGLMLFYALSERELGEERWGRRLFLVPFVLGLGASLTPNNTRAVWEALKGIRSPFVRTPKAGDSQQAHRYRPRLGIQSFVETAWGLYYLAAAVGAAAAGLWLPLPFLLLFAAAFLLLGVGSIIPEQGAFFARPTPEELPRQVARIRSRPPSQEPPSPHRRTG